MDQCFANLNSILGNANIQENPYLKDYSQPTESVNPYMTAAQPETSLLPDYKSMYSNPVPDAGARVESMISSVPIHEQPEIRPIPVDSLND